MLSRSLVNTLRSSRQRRAPGGVPAAPPPAAASAVLLPPARGGELLGEPAKGSLPPPVKSPAEAASDSAIRLGRGTAWTLLHSQRHMLVKASSTGNTLVHSCWPSVGFTNSKPCQGGPH